MTYGLIEDFRGGLDRRRKRIAAPAGTLWTCENAHITRGGEIEKRKKFVPKYVLPAGTYGLATASGLVYVFGSQADPGVPTGVTYQRLQHPDGLEMTSILDTEAFDGKVYVIAKYSDGSIMHFYDGALVTDWIGGAVRAEMANNGGIAQNLTELINANAAYTATRSGILITITAAVAGTPFTISQSTENVTGGINDQSITLTEVQANVASVQEKLAYVEFSIDGGTASAGVNKVSSITADGIEILGAAVDWTTSNSATASAVVDQINSYISSPDYSAVLSGSSIVIYAPVGSGASYNGITCAVTVAGNVTGRFHPLNGYSAQFANGIDGSAAVAQVYTAEIGGTFEVGDTFSITIDGTVFGSSGNPSQPGTFAITHKSKMHSLAGSIDYFSALNDPSKWNISNTGAGFQNLANQDAGSETLLAAGKFQGNLVYLARRSAQVWFIDVDESKDVQLQNPQNTGTIAPKSVLSYGDLDLFYLSDSGLRSIRQMMGTSNVFVNAVGSVIDTMVTDQLRGLTETQKAAAVSVIEPVDNRFWLSLDTTTYVFSYFPEAKISAFSTYAPGVVFSDHKVIGTQIYSRAGDTIYLYGGDDGNTYDVDATDAYTVTVVTPFLTMGKIATDKYVTGFDIAVDGTWTINLLHDSNDDTRKTRLGIVTNDTYKRDFQAASGYGPVFAVELICNTPGAARIANFALHYAEDESP